jgi:hypothetical protein
LSDDSSPEGGEIQTSIERRSLFARAVVVDATRLGTPDPLDETRVTAVFRENAQALLERHLLERFGAGVSTWRGEEPIEALGWWDRLSNQLKDERLDAVGYEPRPHRLVLDPELDTSLPRDRDAILLVRIEAFYESKPTGFLRSAAPMAKTLLGAAVGVAVAGAIGSPVALLPVYAPGLDQEGVLHQLFLIDGRTHDLLWAHQLFTPGHFEEPLVLERGIRHAVAAIPPDLSYPW